MRRLLFAALSVGLLAGRGATAQSTREPIQGVWRVVEATIAEAGGSRSLARAQDRTRRTGCGALR